MKAVRFHEYGDAGVLRYEDVGQPVPGDGEVRVRVAATSFNLKQVFITSRIYGGYANGHQLLNGDYVGCTNPEPFAYEEAFAVQRLIVAQIDSTNDGYSGQVDYTKAPWFDWGPYLWASGQNFSSAGVNWCNGQGSFNCQSRTSDFRSGSTTDQTEWGDFTHPAAPAQNKVATQIMNFLTGPSMSPFVQQWIGF